MPYIFALTLATLSADPSAAYAWPLDLPRVLTSSFLEYRAGRYHMGIDLRTGPVGQDVFAASDGYVSRIRCSPYGYGKAVYLQLDDGNLIVYAHLDDYAPVLRDYVRRAQHDRKAYAVDLYPDPGEFRFARGEFIAKSGQTGIGVPHLHYEIRDKAGAPINPRRLDITWPDSTRPVFRKVLVMPLGPDAAVRGGVAPVVLPVRSEGGGGYRADRVDVEGPVAIGVDLIDPANGGGTRLGVHAVVLREDGREIFRVQHDGVSYANGQDGVVAYHPFMLDRGRFLMLWRWPGNDSELYRYSETDGRFDIGGEDEVVLTVVAEDFQGNEATLTVPLRNARGRGSAGAASGAQSTRPGKLSFDSYGQGLIVTAAFPGAEATRPEIRITFDGADTDGPAPMDIVDARTFQTVISEISGPFRVTGLHPRLDASSVEFVAIRRGDPSRSYELEGLRIAAGPESAYGTLYLKVDTLEERGTSTLSAVGTAYRLWPEEAPIEAPLTISFPLPDAAETIDRVNIYRKSRAGWTFQETRRRGERLEVSVRKLGIYMAMEDIAPPQIRILHPKPNQRFSSARPSIRASIRDTGSDIDEFSATYNGRWLLMSYDPEDRSMRWEEDEDLPVGLGTVEFRVTDQAGNERVERVDIEIVAGTP